MKISLEGKVAIVAGAGQGVGRAAAHLFARAGAKVVIAARTQETLQDTAKLITQDGGDAEVQIADLSRKEDSERVVASAMQRFGRLDAVYCCSGSFEAGATLEMTDDSLERLMASNFYAQFNTARAAAAVMAENGGGAIVLTAAVFGPISPAKKLAAYSASKGALLSTGLAMAADLRDSGVRVNLVCPGTISHHYQPDRDPTEDRTLGKGAAWPEDVARAALFLCSDEAYWITGATLNVDGGYTVARDAW